MQTPSDKTVTNNSLQVPPPAGAAIQTFGDGALLECPAIHRDHFRQWLVQTRDHSGIK